MLLILGFISLSLCEAFIMDENCVHCNWNGVCKTESRQCECYQGFKGTDCSVDCGCQGHGVCNQDNTCQCDNGWKWSSSQHKCIWDCTCPTGVQCMGPGVCACTQACRYGTCWNGQCECWEGYTGDRCDRLDKNTMMNRNISVGMNIEGLSYWSPELKFVDVAKLSSAWITQRDHDGRWDTHEQNNITWRNDGYPARLEKSLSVVKLVFRSTAGVHGPQGNFSLLYDGDGEITFALVSHTVHYNGKGRKTVEFHEGNQGILIKIMRTNENNPIHNIRLIMPGFEDRHELFPFYPPFVENLKRYSELRFMDFLITNGHTPEPTTWSTRRLTTFHTQTGSEGGAIEYAILLANILGADPWFCQPHAADDDFLSRFARLALSDLRPDVKVYVEYSNEVWNSIFRQTTYTKEQGKKLGLDPQDWKAGAKYYNKRATEVADIWTSVLGNRVIPVWAWQTAYYDYTRQIFEDLGTRAAHFKAYAITGYFGCDKVTGTKHNISSMSPEEIHALCHQEFASSIRNFHFHMNLSRSHGLKLLMYEGGPGLESSTHDASTQYAIAYNRHDLMADSVNELMQAWYDVVYNDPQNTAPGGLFNYFASVGQYSKYGSWGMLEYTGQDPYTSPKYLATHRFINSHYHNQYMGPICSFVRLNASELYGCFRDRSSGSQRCGHTADNGMHWTGGRHARRE
ncbi:uncharacterized protein LOC127836133 isoform X2 [Dreissena polymorpha]|uniref:uncharacterized protein LOC127836133 isoform X2 n=1 Tax=Dreissena polymorpha TaxID=45954 RepID=UPI0022640DF2|nr:uncharacterized protein LOC127836133 isoform X2 [Dreissena polymorpha]